MIGNIKSIKQLSKIKPGNSAAIASFTDNVIANKLKAMGLLPGTSISLIRKTPLGNTFYVKANNQFLLALRKQEAACIILR